MRELVEEQDERAVNESEGRMALRFSESALLGDDGESLLVVDARRADNSATNTRTRSFTNNCNIGGTNSCTPAANNSSS